MGDIDYELFASARDCVGADRVDVEFVGGGQSVGAWQSRVLERLRAEPFTHLIAYVEHDPGPSTGWHWDHLFARLRQAWAGTAVALFYDSAHRLHLHMADRLARLYNGTVVVAIDRDIRRLVRQGVSTVGPVFLPISRGSIERIDLLVEEGQKTYDVTFIGEMYPYRHEVVTALVREGLDIAVNPHRSPGGGRSTYLDYVGAMSRSWITVNFSRCSGPPVEQLKSRVLEAGLAGTVVVTDDRYSTRTFFRPGDQFLTATSPREFASVCAAALADREGLARMAASFRQSSIEIATMGFWSEVDCAVGQRSGAGRAARLLGQEGK